MEKILKLKNKFNLKEIVYHKVSGTKGIIVCIRIVVDSTYKPFYEYFVTENYEKKFWVDEMELTNEQIID